MFVQDPIEAECNTGNGCCDHVSGAGTKFVFDLSADTNLANSFYIRTRADQAMPDNIIVRQLFSPNIFLIFHHYRGCVWQIWLHSEFLHSSWRPSCFWFCWNPADLLLPPHSRRGQDCHWHLWSFIKSQNQWPHASWGRNVILWRWGCSNGIKKV